MVERAEGIYLYGHDGKRYIDGLSGLWNAAVGHGRPELAAAAATAVRKNTFTNNYVGFTNEAAIELAQRVVELCYPTMQAVYFTNSGSEANETNFKAARFYWSVQGRPGKNKIISRVEAYHGNTLGAMSATGMPVFYANFRPTVAEIIPAATPNATVTGGGRIDAWNVRIDNIVAAVNEIARRLFEDAPAPLTPEMISEFNEMVLRDLELDPEVVPGEFRQYSVAAGPYVGAPAEDIPHLVARLCDWLQAEFEPPADHPDMVMAYVIIKAVIAHLYFEWIHPFGDGNGRTGRLVEFQILVSSGVPSPAAHLLSNHYNLTRSAYYRELNLASRSGGDVIPFVCYAAEGFVDGLREQIGRVQAMQMDVAWENYVHSVLDDESSPTTRRRRTLVLELSRATKLVPRSDLLELTGRVAEAYAGKTGKTLTRDLNALLKLGLLVRVPDGYEANKDMMRAFLAAKVQSSQVTEPGQDRRGGQLP